jgi:uncharacterized protein YbaR (Trm112 family)
MTSETEQPLLTDMRVLSLLACPVCHGDLRLVGSTLACAGCGRGYPIVDGIPVLIAGREATAESGIAVSSI